MEDDKKRDLPGVDLDPLSCAEMSPVFAEVECLEEHFRISEEELQELQEVFWAEPTDEELIEAFRERGEDDDPFYDMYPSEFDDKEDYF